MYIISNKIVPNTQVSYSLLNIVFSSLTGQIYLHAEYSQCESAENRRIPFTFVPILEQAYLSLSLYEKNILHW